MKNLFATVSYSFDSFYNNLNTQGQMIFSTILFLIVVLCVLLFITYLIQSVHFKLKIKNLKQEKTKKTVLEEKQEIKKKKVKLK